MRRRHTKRDLAHIFKERGLRANRLLGQNFLVDHNVLDFICRAGDLSGSDVVLEIGAGTGLMTEHLARTGGAVVAVEIDRSLFEIAADYMKNMDVGNVRFLCADIHAGRHRVNPEVESALAEAMRTPGRRLKVVSNLPYCISTDLVVSLLEMSWAVERMVLTVQKEFADRMLARAGTRDYSPLTLLLGARADVVRLRNLPPSVFWPVPDVASSIVRITPDAGRFAEIGDYALFKSIIAALFSQRRKTAAGVLGGVGRPRLSKREAGSALEAAGIAGDVRADALSPAQAVALSNAIGALRPAN